jgi:hypothetical protein
MTADPFLRCSCRNPVTGRPYGQGQCPSFRKKDHGAWWFRYDAPRAPGEKRRQPMVGPFGTKKEANDALIAILASLGRGAPAPDRSLLVGAYLTDYMRGKPI